MTVDKRNIFLRNTETSLGYSGRSIPIKPNYPVRKDVNAHANFIQSKLNDSYERSKNQKQAAAIRYKNGVYLEFSGSLGHELSVKSLEDRRQGIRLLNVKENMETKQVKAIVYVPDGKEVHFLNKVRAYGTEVSKKSGNPKNNDLISSIEDISLAMLDSFWTGKIDDMPDEEAKWCEVWIRYDVKNSKSAQSTLNEDLAITRLIQCCEELGIEVNERTLTFPERIVKLIFAKKSQLVNLINICEYIAEFRRAPEQTSFFDDLSGANQQEWIEELLARTDFIDQNITVCLLDTGLNSEHPLLIPAIVNPASIQAVNSAWNSNDHDGHGTEMAGVALYYNLKEKMSDSHQVTINHKIESVKILPPKGENSPELYGAITEQAVFLSEITNPKAIRTLCMAVTAPNYNTDDGSPSSWSAAIDSITSGVNGDGQKRLFFISGGNVHPIELNSSPYPDVNILHSIENPGQSWNAITVGAYSNDVRISSSDYNGCKAIADVGELSPYSSTSKLWNDKWPIKPEILLDGGNMVTNGTDSSECEDLSLLTTSKDFLTKPLTTTWGTSSATAQASWMASQIHNEYPDIWPETTRALLVHSANWTNKMINQFRTDDKKTVGIKHLLRTCGYGIPNLEKAIECAGNSVNLVIQSELQPFKSGKMNDMHIHKIPWPKDVLQSLGEIDAKLKVTLSYFIEPGPGEIGWKDKYRYPSCGLRFDVINSDETLEDFKKRVNVKMRGDDKKDSGDGTKRNWYLGPGNRDVGSIHSDFCEDVAINFCDTNYVAVYPVVGWWRERGYLGKSNEKIRYSLIVSIETPEVDTDLYTPIVTQIEIEQSVEVSIET
ncbi:S8 family peptidase [Listeria monocytogenes]|nr:S8 family peptidase [Listeria monocytogenes]